MAAIWMRKTEDGGLYPSDLEGEDFLASISLPEVKVDVTEANLRSIPEHRLWFKCLASVYDASERYKELYDNSEHLRAHLLIKVGHCDSDMYEAESYEAALLQTEAVRRTFERTRRKGQYAVLKTVYGDGKYFTVFKTPRSVRITGKNSIGQHQFHLIVSQTFDIIHSETRISVDDLRRDWEDLRAQGKTKRRIAA
jgi:hypothetical protein